MKTLQILALAVSAALLVSCLGGGVKQPPEATPAPVANPNPRPDRPPPPPQPQDGSMIVTPGGTSPVKVPDGVPEVSEKDKSSALEAAEREIVRRKNDAAEADDAVSKALKNVSEDDLEKAFSELKKAVDKYPKTAE